MVKSKHVPVGWPTVIPRIAVDDSEALVAFLQHVFGAVGRFRWKRPSGTSISRFTCHSRMIAGATSFGRPAPASTASIRSGTPASLRRSEGPMCRGACRPDSGDAPLASPIVSVRHSSFPRAWSPNEARWEPRRGVIPGTATRSDRPTGPASGVHGLDKTLIARGRGTPQEPMPQRVPLEVRGRRGPPLPHPGLPRRETAHGRGRPGDDLPQIRLTQEVAWPSVALRGPLYGRSLTILTGNV